MMTPEETFERLMDDYKLRFDDSPPVQSWMGWTTQQKNDAIYAALKAGKPLEEPVRGRVY